MGRPTISIGLDVTSLLTTPLTGVGYYAKDLTQALLERQGLRCMLFAGSARGNLDHFRELAAHSTGARYVRWPQRLKIPMWTRLNWPPLEWFTGPIDIAHGLFDLLPAARRAPRLVTVHDLTYIRYPDAHTEQTVAVHSRMLRHAVRKADAIVAVSHSTKRDLEELMHAEPRKVHVVHNGVNIQEFSAQTDAAAFHRVRTRLGIEREFLVHLGTLEPRKNIPRLLQAYARVRDARADCPQLVLAGRAGWKCEPVFQTLETLSLPGDVLVAGYVDRAEAIALLQNAYACAYPSLCEGFGLPVLEAMAARTPVLTSTASSLPEVIGDAGILVDPESIDSIEAGLLELLDNPETARARTEAAFERAQQFTWARSAQALEQLYRRLLD